jgi:hypothetical protein
MPRTEQEGRKRSRLDLTDTSMMTPATTLETPEWVRRIDNGALQKLALAQQVCNKKEDLLRQLEGHMDAGTTPTFLKVQVTPTVHQAHQATLDEKVKQAAKVFEQTILREIVSIRKEEVAEAQAGTNRCVTERHQQVDLTVNQLRLEDLGPTQNAVNNWQLQFINNAEAIVKHEKTKHFHQRRALQEKRLAAATSRAEQNLNRELQDPVLQNLQQQVEKLTKLIEKQNKPDSKQHGTMPYKTKHKKQGNRPAKNGNKVSEPRSNNSTGTTTRTPKKKQPRQEPKAQRSDKQGDRDNTRGQDRNKGSGNTSHRRRSR